MLIFCRPICLPLHILPLRLGHLMRTLPSLTSTRSTADLEIGSEEYQRVFARMAQKSRRLSLHERDATASSRQDCVTRSSRISAIFAAVLASIPGHVYAAGGTQCGMSPDLFRAETIVTGLEEAERTRGLREIMGILLVKTT